MIQKEWRFVIRGKYNRYARTEDGTKTRLLDEIYEVEPVAQRTVTLSKRKGSAMPHSRQYHPSRSQRTVKLNISAKAIEVHKTRKQINKSDPVKLNVVRVFEDSRRSDAIEWILITTEPIATNILNLRLSENDTEESMVLNKVQWEILKISAGCVQKKIKVFKDALYEIARLGGHITGNNRPPGWITLLRGYKKLQEMEYGWRLARGEM